nr:immunoglobulin light chain junction region [Macaca mulatta]
CLQGYRIPWTF